jgi:hypothetical protein
MGDPDDARRQRAKANRERLNRKSKTTQKTRTTASMSTAEALAQSLPHSEPVEALHADANGKRARQRTTQHQGDDMDDDEETPLGLHPDDPANFLKLCRALRLLMSRRITDIQINQADDLLRSYCLELISVSL